MKKSTRYNIIAINRRRKRNDARFRYFCFDCSHCCHPCEMQDENLYESVTVETSENNEVNVAAIKEAEEKAKKEAELKAKKEAEEKAKKEAEEKAKKEAEEKAKKEAEEKAKKEAEEKAKKEAEEKAKKEAEEKAKKEAEEKAKKEAEEKAKKKAEDKAKKEAEEKAKKEAEEKAKREAEEKAKKEAEEKAKKEAEEKAKKEAEKVAAAVVVSKVVEEIKETNTAEVKKEEAVEEKPVEEKPVEEKGFKLTNAKDAEEIMPRLAMKRARKLIYAPKEVIFETTCTIDVDGKKNDEAIKVKDILEAEIKEGLKLGYLDKYDGLKMSELKEEYENDTVYELADQEFKKMAMLLDGDNIKVYLFDWTGNNIHHIGNIPKENVETIKPYLVDIENYSFDLCGIITGGKCKTFTKNPETGKIAVTKGKDGNYGVDLDITIIKRKD